MFEIMDRDNKIKTDNILDYITTMDKELSESQEMNEKLMELIEDKNSTIEELTSTISVYEKESLELRNSNEWLRDKKGELENEVDCLRNKRRF